MNKTITTLLAAAGIAASAPASAVIVGGVDFGALGADPISYSSGNCHTGPNACNGQRTGRARLTALSPPSTATIPIALTEAAIVDFIMSATFHDSMNFPGKLTPANPAGEQGYVEFIQFVCFRVFQQQLHR